MVSLGVKIAGLSLKTPLMAASGTFGYGGELLPAVGAENLGAIIVKGISLLPREGNPPPRLAETPCGLLNSIGLENVGVERFIEEKLPFLRKHDVPVIVNILGDTADEYRALAERLGSADGIAGLEVNIGCPNVEAGGMSFGTAPAASALVTGAVRSVWPGFLMVKLTPNVTDITEIARAVEAAGADCLSLINTVRGMAVNVETRKPRLKNVIGGLSGPAIKPIALRMVYEAWRAVKIPVVGVGGITSALDALEFLIAGASAVQVGTATLVSPTAIREIAEGLGEYLASRDIPGINDLVGSLVI